MRRAELVKIESGLRCLIEVMSTDTADKETLIELITDYLYDHQQIQLKAIMEFLEETTE